MSSVIVGVIGTLLGVVIGGMLQQWQASRTRRWHLADSLSDVKRHAYAEFLRSISASYGQAMSGQRDRSEDVRLHAAMAEIEVLADGELVEAARDLVDTVIEVHSLIAEGGGVDKTRVADVDRRRRAVLALFKADLGLQPDL